MARRGKNRGGLGSAPEKHRVRASAALKRARGALKSANSKIKAGNCEGALVAIGAANMFLGRGTAEKQGAIPQKVDRQARYVRGAGWSAVVRTEAKFAKACIVKTKK